MIQRQYLSVLFLFMALFLISTGCQRETKTDKPNIVLIMADDIGYSDVGCYGTDIIKTPNIDRLAYEGLRMTAFYNMAKCNPTRSSMLTGLYHGGNGAVHLAHITEKAGYHNIMSGKEHFDPWVPDYCSAENVFDHSFYFWATTEYFLPPSGEFERPFYLEGKEIPATEIEYEKAPMYKTDFITDYALNWLDEAFQKDQPFFLYLPYHAAHFPLQARPEDIKKYHGKFMKGWDQLRQERFNRMQELGVLPPNTKLSAPEGNVNKFRGPYNPGYIDYFPWESLTAHEKDSLELEMAVYAAIIDRMDQNIGRVLRKLDDHGKLDNTLIMFLVDNGSCPYETNKIKDVPAGPANSYWSLRATWANLNNTPWRYYKQYGHEGGSRTPFIAWWPGKIESNTISHQPAHIVDLMPTFLEITQTTYPYSIKGYKTIPYHGKSLLPVLEGKQREEPEFFISGLEKHRMFRQGDWKIARVNGDKWELFNIKNDPAEIENLADELPEKVQELEQAYNTKWSAIEENATSNKNK